MKQHPYFGIIFPVAALLFFSTPCAAQLYRCVDDSGKITYSDTRCGPAKQRTVVKITDNTMDNSNLASEAAIRSSLDSSMSAAGGGRVYVIGNGGGSSQASSSSNQSSPSTRATTVRRRCGG